MTLPVKRPAEDKALVVRHPFQGKPRTIQGTDAKGRPVFLVKARALTPLRAKAANGLTCAGTLAAFAGALLSTNAAESNDGLVLLATIFGPFLSAPLQRFVFGKLLQKRREIALTAETFSFKTLTGWKHYNRHLEHSFALYQHDKADEEAIEQELEVRKASAKGKVIGPKRYYADSYHLVFEYLGQRIDVMNIYKKKEAQKILNRVSACDAIVNAGLGQGKGAALTPEDDWAEEPGALPQE